MVEESHLTHTSDPEMTITSLGYNTAEALPMTVYYRKSGEGSSRPTLDDLRQGRMDKPPEERSQEQVGEGGVLEYYTEFTNTCTR